jgi:flagellar basal-body rod protein FlgC
MSGPFDGLYVPASGMTVYKTWMDALADNVANVSTVTSTTAPAFQERFVIAQANEYGTYPGTGVHVAGVSFGDPNGRLVYNPSHPLADAQGMVRMPDMNLSDQMTSLIIAQRAYQLNVAVFERARDSYQKSLEIGK